MSNKQLYLDLKKLELPTYLLGLEIVENYHTDLLKDFNYHIFAINHELSFLTIDGYFNTIFCLDPHRFNGHLIYPIANSFYDFLALILSTGNTAIMHQVTKCSKQEYIQLINARDNIDRMNSSDILDIISKFKFILNIDAIDHPYEYIKDIFNAFDYSTFENL